VDWISRILEDFPEAAILHVLRDPRDVLLSLRDVPWSRRGRLFYIRWWARCGDLLGRHPALDAGNFLEVRYEDLLRSPETVLKGACRLIGVEYEAGMADDSRSRSALFDPDAEPWKRKTLEPIDIRNMGKWRHRMWQGDIALFNLLLADRMREKGYEVPPASRPVALAMLCYAWIEYGIDFARHHANLVRQRARRQVSA
jgi:hypothetical protein